MLVRNLKWLAKEGVCGGKNVSQFKIKMKQVLSSDGESIVLAI